MLIVHVTTTDPAGSVINFVNAVNRYTPHCARLITTMKNDYDFPGDMDMIADAGEEIEALLVQADVIHLHKVRAEEMLIPVKLPKTGVDKEYRVSDFITVGGRTKKVVHHIHGHPYERQHVQENAALYDGMGATVLASTPDLEEMYKPHCSVRYFPNCVPINDAKYLPRATDEQILCADGKRRYMVFQSPTDAVLKNVAILEDVHANLKDVLPVFLMIVTGVSQTRMLTMKRSAHVVFDHMQGYYGLCSLEAMSMGKPVIAGLSDYTVKAICDFFGIEHTQLPWQRAHTAAGLQLALSDILSNDRFRRELGARGRKFMEEVWSDKIIGQRLAAFYESL